MKRRFAQWKHRARSRWSRRQQDRLMWTRGEKLALLLIAIAAAFLPHPLPSPEAIGLWLRESLQSLLRPGSR